MKPFHHHHHTHAFIPFSVSVMSIGSIKQATYKQHSTKTVSKTRLPAARFSARIISILKRVVTSQAEMRGTSPSARMVMLRCSGVAGPMRSWIKSVGVSLDSGTLSESSSSTSSYSAALENNHVYKISCVMSSWKSPMATPHVQDMGETRRCRSCQ